MQYDKNKLLYQRAPTRPIVTNETRRRRPHHCHLQRPRQLPSLKAVTTPIDPQPQRAQHISLSAGQLPAAHILTVVKFEYESL